LSARALFLLWPTNATKAGAEFPLTPLYRPGPEFPLLRLEVDTAGITARVARIALYAPTAHYPVGRAAGWPPVETVRLCNPL